MGEIFLEDAHAPPKLRRSGIEDVAPTELGLFFTSIYKDYAPTELRTARKKMPNASGCNLRYVEKFRAALESAVFATYIHSHMSTPVNQQAEATATWIKTLRAEIGKVIVGQEHLVDRLLVGLLANGHVLLEGVPGLAKTMSVRTLAAAVHASFHRIQFTPDLLPADIVGTLIYNPQDGKYHATRGPGVRQFRPRR